MPLTITDQSALERSVNELEDAAQRLSAGGVEAFGTGDFCRAWPFIRKALNTAKYVTPAWVDAVIDAAVSAGQAHCSDDA
jgi:hypothetical protein